MLNVAFEIQDERKAQEPVATLIHIHPCRKRAFYSTKHDTVWFIISSEPGVFCHSSFPASAPAIRTWGH